MIMLDWDKEHIFEDMCNEMAGKLKEDGLPIVAWGDTTEEMFVPFFERYGLSIDNICDKDNGKQNIVRNLGGGDKRIISPSEVDGLYKEYNAVILVPYPERIKAELNSFRNKPKRVFYIDIAKLHLHPMLFHRPNRKNFMEKMEKLAPVEGFLEDSKSKQILQNVLNYWISGERYYVRDYAEMQDKQYLDTMEFHGEEIFLNIGACDGRYSERFRKMVGTYQKIYNFECDPNNFQKMKENLAGYRDCYFSRKGIWDKHDKLKFNADGNAGSCIREEGNIEIEVDSIDNMFKNVPITFIKADIEGAEYRLLDGAQNTIKEYKPKLAICCYHQMEDLIEIPLKIKEINPNYKIKIRHYTDTLTETVCYAY